nr:helix-turn-helix transcriptional regulator [Lactococcus cremoris]
MAKNRIKELRESSNPKITLKELSEKLKEKGLSFTDSQLSKFENGTSTPRNEKIWGALAEIFNTSQQYILGLTMYKNDTEFLEDRKKGSLQTTGLEFSARWGNDNLDEFQSLLKEADNTQKTELLRLLQYLTSSYLNSVYNADGYIYLKKIFFNIMSLTELKLSEENDIEENQDLVLAQLTRSIIDYIDNVKPYPQDYDDNPF